MSKDICHECGRVKPAVKKADPPKPPPKTPAEEADRANIKERRLASLQKAREARAANAKLKAEGKPPNPSKYPPRKKAAKLTETVA
jgi:hypothetical protein